MRIDMAMALAAFRGANNRGEGFSPPGDKAGTISGAVNYCLSQRWSVLLQASTTDDVVLLYRRAQGIQGTDEFLAIGCDAEGCNAWACDVTRDFVPGPMTSEDFDAIAKTEEEYWAR